MRHPAIADDNVGDEPERADRDTAAVAVAGGSGDDVGGHQRAVDEGVDVVQINPTAIGIVRRRHHVPVDEAVNDLRVVRRAAAPQFYAAAVAVSPGERQVPIDAVVDEARATTLQVHSRALGVEAGQRQQTVTVDLRVGDQMSAGEDGHPRAPGVAGGRRVLIETDDAVGDGDGAGGSDDDAVRAVFNDRRVQVALAARCEADAVPLPRRGVAAGDGPGSGDAARRAAVQRPADDDLDADRVKPQVVPIGGVGIDDRAG